MKPTPAGAFMNKLFVAVLLSALGLSAEARVCSEILHEEITVDGRNDEWTSAQVKIGPRDLVLVFAEGQVKVGGWTGEVGPGGAPGVEGIGRLEMKVGTGTVVPVGARWVGAFQEGGTIKFRVHDTKYGDNSGSFSIHLIIVPAGVLPPAVKVQPDA
jgi:hypothetical protein